MNDQTTPETATTTPNTGQPAPDSPNVQVPSDTTGSGKTDQPTTAVATQQAPALPAKLQRPAIVIEDSSEVQYLMDTGRFDQAQRVALTMATSTITPKHLRFEKQGDNLRELTIQEKAANCFRIVNQALRWGMDPFAVMDKTYFVDGRLAYEGQLVSAVITSSGVLQGRLNATYDGEGENRRITVSGTLKGEAEPRIVTWTVKQGRTKNAMWSANPDQKLWYSATLLWARRHCPEVVLGVMIEDDVEKIAEERPVGDVHVMTELDVAKSKVWEAMPGYGGSDKPALMAQCRDAVKSNEPIDFWYGMLAQIEPPVK